MRYVTRETIIYRAASFGTVGVIPKGTPCIPADNLPTDKGPRFWACKWPIMTPEEASWERAYGFLLEEAEVRGLPDTEAEALAEARGE